MPTDQRLVDIAQSLLDNLAAALTTAGVDVPTRQYIAAGDVAQDIGEECDEAFIVSWLGTNQGVIGATVNPQIKCDMPTIGQFAVILLRCVPSLDEGGRAPSESDLQAFGTRILTDAMTLPAQFIDLFLAGELVAGCSQGSIVSVLPIGPSGGVGGTVMTVQMGLV